MRTKTLTNNLTLTTLAQPLRTEYAHTDSAPKD